MDQLVIFLFLIRLQILQYLAINKLFGFFYIKFVFYIKYIVLQLLSQAICLLDDVTV